jgi:hypothetical protein
MSEDLAGSVYDKYTNARIAVANVLRGIGHRVSYGAAVFPSAGSQTKGCNPGSEVFATMPGDPPSYAQKGEDGPILKGLLTKLAFYAPAGGTPTSATLETLTPTLTALNGETVVILATDGAPNCNVNAVCGADQCIPNIEGASLGGVPCSPTFNCCDPNNVVDGGANCVDGPASVDAVATLASSGIKTYVVGMPGSEVYSDVLDQLAEAGQTARPGAPKYYDTTDAEELTDVLRSIGIEVAISCEISIDFSPEDPNLVNVYFDTSLLPFDPENGWSWQGDTEIEIHGQACTDLKSGDILQVQVVAGCPTIVR